jgi:hypothetical protein
LVPSEIRAEALSPTDKDKENAPPSASNLAYPSNNQTRPLKKSKMGHATSAVIFTSTAKRQRTFFEDLCKLFVSCGISWNALSNPEMRQFMGKWIPDVTLQDQRIISGQVLDSEVQKVENRVIGKVKGKMVTGKCDNWDNIAKTHVVTSMMTVEHKVSLAVCETME